MLVVRRDPFEGAEPARWPAAELGELSLGEPIPVGVDEQGDQVVVELIERNVLIGGEPGAGKSVALSTVLAAGALDPDARIWLLDGKLVELAACAPVAERVAGPSGEEAIELLRAAGGDGGSLPRAARAWTPEGTSWRWAAGALGGVRRACVLSDGAGEGRSSRSSPSCCEIWWLAAVLRA